MEESLHCLVDKENDVFNNLLHSLNIQAYFWITFNGKYSVNIIKTDFIH